MVDEAGRRRDDEGIEIGRLSCPFAWIFNVSTKLSINPRDSLGLLEDVFPIRIQQLERDISVLVQEYFNAQLRISIQTVQMRLDVIVLNMNLSEGKKIDLSKYAAKPPLVLEKLAMKLDHKQSHSLDLQYSFRHTTDKHRPQFCSFLLSEVPS